MKKLMNKLYVVYLKIFKHSNFIKQKDRSDCGAACLATVANHFNINYPISRIREIAGTDQKGTSALGLIKAAEKLGLKAEGVKAKAVDLNEKLQVPLIAHIVEKNILHYIVIYKIIDDKLIIFDPRSGIETINKEDFKQKWSNILILLTPQSIKNVKEDIVNRHGIIKAQLKQNQGLLVQIFIASLIYTSLGILGSFYFKYLIDSILVNGLLKSLHIISLAVIIITILKVLMDTFRNHLTLYLSQQIDINLITDYIEHILSLPLSFYEKREVGEILSRINDSSKIREALSSAAISIMIDSVLILAGGTILYLQSKFLFKIAIILIPFYIALVLTFANKHKKVRKEEMEKAAKLQSTLVETIRGIESIKSSNSENKSYLYNENKFIDFINKVFRAGFLRNVQNSIDNLLAGLGEIIILWTGGYQVINGHLTVGQLITFNALLAYFYKPLQNLIKLQPKIQEAFVALRRLKDIMVLPPTTQDSKLIKITKIKNSIEFRSIDYIYNMRQKVLNGLSFKVKKGEKVAIVGESGAGKTTIIKLLLKFYKSNRGSILIDGTNIDDIDTKILREKIGYVSQEPFLFNRNIRENINLKGEKYSLNQIIKAAKRAQIHKYINKLPQRYNSIVNEKGKNLSGGERQRIAIARVLLKNPEIIIFDEATNHLDYQTESNIFHTLDKIASDKTVIIIAHRLRSIINCDKIFYLKKGKIIEKGTHQSLINKKGAYYNLWDLQTNIKNEGVN